MSHLKELTTFKQELFGLLTGDTLLMRALVNTDNINSLVNDLPRKDGQRQLPRHFMYENLFPFPWIATGMETEKKAYITVDIMNSGLMNNYYKDMAIGVYVFCHQDVIKMINEDGSVVNRMDFIAQRIDELLNQNRNFGIGKLAFAGFKSDRMTDQIPGQCLIYSTATFDR